MTRNTTDTFCGQCGEPIQNEDSANRTPCPKCGSTKRTYHLAMHATVSVSVSVDAHVVSYPQSFLDTAKDWIDGGIDELYSMAVILCHVACELATDRAIDDAFKSVGNEALQQVVRKRIKSNRMATKETRQLYTSLTGDNIEKQGFWPKYTESVTRRDSIAHRGVLVSKEDAEKSHAATSELVAYLDKQSNVRA